MVTDQSIIFASWCTAACSPPTTDGHDEQFLVRCLPRIGNVSRKELTWLSSFSGRVFHLGIGTDQLAVLVVDQHLPYS